MSRMWMALWLALAPGIAGAQTTADPIDAESQDLRRQALELERDLRVTQERSLYPASSQIAVFVGQDQGTFFTLQSLTLQIDGIEVASHQYSEAEVNALIKGGTQQLFIGNLPNGHHRVTAVFGGFGPHYPIRRAVTLELDKTSGTQLVELRASDDGRRQAPVFAARAVNP